MTWSRTLRTAAKRDDLDLPTAIGTGNIQLKEICKNTRGFGVLREERRMMVFGSCLRQKGLWIMVGFVAIMMMGKVDANGGDILRDTAPGLDIGREVASIGFTQNNFRDFLSAVLTVMDTSRSAGDRSLAAGQALLRYASGYGYAMQNGIDLPGTVHRELGWALGSLSDGNADAVPHLMSQWANSGDQANIRAMMP